MAERRPSRTEEDDRGEEQEQEEGEEDDKDPHRSIISDYIAHQDHHPYIETRKPSRSSSTMTGSRPGRPSSSCCSSNRTVIEADQQLNQLDHTPSIEDDVILNPSSRPRRAGRSSSSSSNRSSARNHDSVDRTGGGGGGGGTYRSDDDDDDDRSRSEHERRLRLIDANRTMSRLVNDADEDEDHDLESHGHQPYHHPRASTVDETRTIRTEILLSSMNQRTGFELDRQLTILQLKHHLLQHWPSDWNQKQEIPKVNHVNQLRMVYMGRFLDEDDTLNS